MRRLRLANTLFVLVTVKQLHNKMLDPQLLKMCLLPSSVATNKKMKVRIRAHGSQTYIGSVSLDSNSMRFTADGDAGTLIIQIHNVHTIKVVEQVSVEIWCSNFKFYLLQFSNAHAAGQVCRHVIKFRCVSPLLNMPVHNNVDHLPDFYDHLQEYRRVFGVDLGTSNSKYRVSTCNSTFEVCDTYPFLVVVPSLISDKLVVGCAQFRSKQRFPAVTWLCKENGASLSRCAQPLSGVMTGSNRSQEDEAIVGALLQATERPGGGGKRRRLIIADARPGINAQANRMKGGGTERIEHYVGCSLEHLDIENIHKVRDSFEAVLRLTMLAVKVENGLVSSSADDGRWHRNLADSRWLFHVQTILKGAQRIARIIGVEGDPVLVHCSDGWDRTSQLTSLVQVILDPFTRTMQGFCTLVCKEWLSFGHMFMTRGSHHVDESRENSPVFLQFIDCVYQIQRRFPSAFQFNSNFLMYIVDHLYAADHGTFLFNCEQQRCAALLSHRTRCFWRTLLAKTDVKNSRYDASKQHKKYLFFNPNSWTIKLWEKLYLRSF